MAQEIYNNQDDQIKRELLTFTIELMIDLYNNELDYTEHVYNQVGLSSDVKKFVRYNANKALQNLGFPTYFEEEDVNPIVINGLSTKTKSHDFFSQKGNSYKKATHESIKDEDWVFED